MDRMRTITLIIVHCSANRQGSTLRMMDIDHLHRSLGWKGCGYHFVIPTDGTIETGRPLEQVGAHCKNHNRYSIGVCYIGDSPTMERLPWIPERKPNEKPYRVCFVNCISDSPKP